MKEIPTGNKKRIDDVIYKQVREELGDAEKIASEVFGLFGGALFVKNEKVRDYPLLEQPALALLYHKMVKATFVKSDGALHYEYDEAKVGLLKNNMKFVGDLKWIVD